MNLRSIEIFAGAGGLGLGVSRAGFTPSMVVEWNKWCCDTIRENQTMKVAPVVKWPTPIQGDVRNVDFKQYEGQIELVTGGPPCQPFSVAGKGRAFDDHRDMWSEAVRSLREVKPKAFIFENVKGLACEAFVNHLSYIIHQLTFPEIIRKRNENWGEHLARLERHKTSGRYRGLCYNVVFRVVNAADYGIPQRRERLVVVGFRQDIGVQWSFPAATHSLDALLWDQLKSTTYWDRHKVGRKNRLVDDRFLVRAKRLAERPITAAWRTTRDAICDLPDPEAHPQKALLIPNHFFQPGARTYPGHTGSPLDEPSKTLKAGVHGVPGGENMLVRPDGSIRYFTVRESARLQTFADDYIFHGSWGETMRQLGNAVPVELAAIIANSVRSHLR